MFPLGTALLPGEPLPLRIFEPRYRQMLADCLDSGPDGGRFGVTLIARGHEVGGGDVRHDIGTFARIENVLAQPDGRASLTCTGAERFRVIEWLADDPYPRAVTETLPAIEIDPDDEASLRALALELRAFVDEVAEVRPEAVPVGLPDFDLADLAVFGVFEWAIRLPIGPADRQRLLECHSVADQVTVLHDVAEGLTAMIRFGR
ncbi:LON peptidase substrate-binding domain-containing protein [Gordonia sp. ABSL11-1]|uniref:LON peptidase substrate-binding domain-containing protein n=1 Tax=Gordonia sp. ABSL11-1 TaxID=3053924 RepID=UPI0025746284|nr:LON peptidase substrate-binding domain-containing protein [Gordonia sp. ABSL11-1]MDL9945220.1 LON peptidase substrate-binding domain-containing protein [Gordonia sp. ABSL11-1]